jgi:3-oxoadipate enol-lactonase
VPLLLLHALGSGLELWDVQAAALSSSGFRIIRYDMRGHGRSTAPAGEYSIADLGRDALAVLDALSVDQACIAGVSIGGLTSMWLGSQAPARVRALVLANTTARVGTRERWLEREQLVRTRGMAAVADLAMTTWFTEAFRQRNPGTVARFHRMVASTAPEPYIGCCAALREADLRPDLHRIHAPTLVIGGTQDPTAPIAEVERVKNAIAGASLEMLESAHLGNVECADAFTWCVSDFFAKAAQPFASPPSSS